MSPPSPRRLPLAFAALLFAPLFAGPARALPEVGADVPPAAQAAPPPLPSQNESPDELEARVHYEKALRAEMDGRLDEADREAKATADAAAASKSARYAEASRRLQERLADRRAKGETGEGESTGIGSRVELVTSATVTGIYLSAWLALTAVPDNGKAAAGIITLGGVASLAGSLLATRNARVGSSWGSGLILGTAYAQSAYLLAGAAAGKTTDYTAGGALATGALGAAVGLGTAILLPLTGGDSGALWTGAIFGGLVPFFVTGAVTDEPKAWAAATLAGGTIGMLGLGIANRSLGWSRGRWNVISLGGGVGFLVGLGSSVMMGGADTTKASVFITWTAGTVVGLALTTWLTSDWSGDERRTAANALFDYRPGQGLGVGNVLSALVPLPSLDGQRGGVRGRLFEARW